MIQHPAVDIFAAVKYNETVKPRNGDNTMELKKFKKNQIIFKQGDYETFMYDIRWGSVGIYENYGEKDQRLLRELRADDMFGEMGLVEARPRSATAVSLEKDTQCVLITNDDFASYFRDKPSKIIAIMQRMSQRIRDLSEEVARLSK